MTIFRKGVPHLAFAWLPVNTRDHGLRWLQRVIRIRIRKTEGYPDSWWEYHAITNQSLIPDRRRDD